MSVVRHEVNLGLAEARNSGLARASGRFVCFLDDDDQLLPDKLDAQADALDGQPDLNVVLHCQAIVDDGISSDTRPSRGLRPAEPLCEYLMCGEGAMPIHSVMVARDLVQSALFTPGQRTQEDYSWLLRLEAQGVRFEFLPRPLVVWHVDMRRPRLSRATSFEAAGRWLDSCGTLVTPKAREAFLAREIAPFVDPRPSRLVVRTVLIAVRSGSISVTEGLKALMKAFLPASAVYRMRQLLPRSRFG